MIKRLRVTVDGNTYDVTVEMAEDTSGQAPAATPLPAPTSAPQIVPAPVAAAAPAPAAPAQPQAQSSGSAGPGDVPSPLAGRVTAIVVTVGQDVKEGDHLLTLEAMKMNTFVFAPKSGKIAAIKTAVSEAVDENQVLMQIG